ncbi:metallophosphoesterase [Tissierella praeacuta]|uniref:metallophosphoesterase n=1 Tax=Tissierella praeacuta TaxID=43131 RepID=UPI0033412FB9
MIFAIGDLHFDNTGEKPMDVFGESWLNHEERIISNWKSIVGEDDLVLLAGDTSWALKLEEAYDDLLKINKLPGKKIIIKGNHDYWWNSLRKLNNLGLESIDFIQNNSFIYNNVGIVGTRGWSSIDSNIADERDHKVFNRELNRLKLSLDSLKEDVDKIIVMLHYPPFNPDLSSNEFIDIMKEYNVDICIYGHLHSAGHKYAVEGIVEGVDVHCISSDYIDFMPKKIL